jgi:serine/threonine protein kinase
MEMQQNNNQGPPFTKRMATLIMWEIARGMPNLHRDKILHRHLKSCNILIDNCGIVHQETHKKFFFCEVADFECSIGVMGTGFWQAPEILLAIQNGNITSNTLTKMADVYSYAMTCYEVLVQDVSLLKVI